MFESAFTSWNSISSSLGLIAQATQPPEKPWYEQGFVVFLGLLLLIFVTWYIAQMIAKSLRLADFGGRISVIMITIVLATLIVVMNGGIPRWGVDLKGGMNLIGSLDLSNFDQGDGGRPPEAKDIIPTLLERVDPSGTREIMIRPLGKDKIEVTIPSVTSEEADDIWNRLISAGHLQFRITADQRFHGNVIALAKQRAEQGNNQRFVSEKDSEGKEKRLGGWYNLARDLTTDAGSDPKTAVLPFKYVPSPGNLMRDKNTGRIILNSEISWGRSIENAGQDLADYCAANKLKPQVLMIEPEDDSTNVEGEHIDSVRSGYDEFGKNCINFVMTDIGSNRLGLLTQINKPDAQGAERQLGIVLDNALHSAPNIQEPIFGNGRITGQFTKAEINDLIVKLRSGKLDVALNDNPISKEYIESNLGTELKNKGVWAIGASFVLVLAFMMIYYRFSGFVACAALLLNLLFILALIMAIRQPLTLTGLAGLVLTVGMSVDANVLIFERIREELDRGSALRMAIRNGFDKATTTIVDANVTTLITALVLYVIGTEQIKGFSVTLILGILMSMFTAIYCSRTVFDIAERKRWLTKISMMKILTRSKFDFLSKKMITGFCSVVLIIAGIVGMYSLGAKILNHDLRGGSTARMVLIDAVEDADEIRTILDNATVEPVDGEEITFTVSKVQSDDPSLKDRVYKIDSNLKTFDGKGEATYAQLDEVLTEVFKDKLQLMHVDVGEISSSNPQTPPENSGDDTTDGATGFNWNPNRAWVAATALANPIGLIQDPGTESNQEGNKTEETKQDDEKKTEESADDNKVDQDAAKPATGDDAVVDSEQDDPAKSGGDFKASGDPSTGPITANKVKTHLSFAHKVSGRGVKTQLSQEASRRGITLDEDQIEVASPDAGIDEDPDTVQSTEWDITLTMSQQSDAEDLLSGWAASFNTKPYFPTISGVGGQIARETQLQALAAIIASLLGIIAYVWIRFQNVAFGLAAVTALIHDVLIVLGAIALSHYVAGALGFIGIENFKISLPIVAALLTIIGYSLNDTIVVFDRIREVRGKRSEITADMINTSISQTLSRTILTSLTTFIVVFILYWFGGDAIHGFAFSLVVGVIVGTYSSIFVASPMLLFLMTKAGLNPGTAIEAE